MRRQLPILIILLTAAIAHSQNSFSLEEAIAYGLEHSTDMQLNKLEVDDAEAKITEYKAIGMPQVNGAVDYNYYLYTPVTPVVDFISPSVYGILENEFPGEVTAPPGPPETFEFSFFTKNNLSAKVDASMLLFDGSYLTGLKAAKLYRELARKRAGVKEEEIKAAITKAYMSILIVDENKETLNKNLSSISKSLVEAEAYYETGFIELLEVKRIKLSKESVETELDKLNQLTDISHDLLKFQMSYPLNDQLVLTEDLEQLVSTFSADENLMDSPVDFSKKAQYAEIEMGQELNALNVERLKKGYLPSLRARAGISESLQRNNLFDGDEAGWLPTVYAGLALNVPIYDGKRKKGQIQQAEIEMQKTNVQKSEYERGIQMQVKTSRLQHNNAKRTLENTKRILEVNEEIYETAQIKFREGVGSSIEVTQAENSLFSAQAEYISALYQLLITKTDLDIALGEL